MAASFFCFLELDRLRGESTVLEAQQLRRGYKGSIAHAECARQEDARKIHQADGVWGNFNDLIVLPEPS